MNLLPAAGGRKAIRAIRFLAGKPVAVRGPRMQSVAWTALAFDRRATGLA